jgi:hypothetical protein
VLTAAWRAAKIFGAAALPASLLITGTAALPRRALMSARRLLAVTRRKECQVREVLNG